MRFVNADCQHIAIENPIGWMNTAYRKPNQIIHPWMFGEPVNKATCLWLKNVPALKATNIVEPSFVIGADGKRYSGPAYYAKDENGKAISWSSAETKRIRSKTYDGIAQAMAEQWGNCLEYYEEEYEQVSFMEV